MRHLNPLDPGAERDRERLFSYVWPDEPDRLATTAAALDVAAAAHWRVERADAGAWVEARLQALAPGRMRVLVHTIVWPYLPDETKAQIERAVRSAGERADSETPLAWFRMEADGGEDGVGLTLTLWPDGEERALGRADAHGRWVRWD